MNYYLQKYAPNQLTYFIYILFISRQIQKSKNDENPASTSKDTCKTILIIIFKLFSHLNLKQLKKFD